MDKIEKTDKSLKEEIQRYLREECSANDEPTIGEIARHFAEWQKKQDLAEMAQSKSPLLVAYANRCFENGKQAMKEQMMKEAVEGRVFMSFAPGHNQMVMADVDLPTNTKVRIVVLKEEEE